MKGRNWFKTYWPDILKIVILIIWFVGSIVFGKFTWKMDYTAEWKRWLALVIGEFAFLYSLVFILAGICAFIGRLAKDNIWDFGGVGVSIILIGLAIIIQLTFWGIVLPCTRCLHAIGVVVVVCSFPMLVGFFLKKKN